MLLIFWWCCICLEPKGSPKSSKIEIDSTTPDFEKASEVFTEKIGVPIDEECVRMLWATCFVPKQSRPLNIDIAGKDLVVHKNPGEISDLTDQDIQEEGVIECGNLYKPVDKENNGMHSNQECIPDGRKNVGNVFKAIQNTRKESNSVNGLQVPSHINGQQVNSHTEVPLGIVDDTNDTQQDNVSKDQENGHENQEDILEDTGSVALSKDKENGHENQEDILEDSDSVASPALFEDENFSESRKSTQCARPMPDISQESSNTALLPGQSKEKNCGCNNLQTHAEKVSLSTICETTDETIEKITQGLQTQPETNVSYVVP